MFLPVAVHKFCLVRFVQCTSYMDTRASFAKFSVSCRIVHSEYDEHLVLQPSPPAPSSEFKQFNSEKKKYTQITFKRNITFLITDIFIE